MKGNWNHQGLQKSHFYVPAYSTIVLDADSLDEAPLAKTILLRATIFFHNRIHVQNFSTLTIFCRNDQAPSLIVIFVVFFFVHYQTSFFHLLQTHTVCIHVLYYSCCVVYIIAPFINIFVPSLWIQATQNFAIRIRSVSRWYFALFLNTYLDFSLLLISNNTYWVAVHDEFEIFMLLFIFVLKLHQFLFRFSCGSYAGFRLERFYH